jgi:hypothetical protein
LREKSALPEHVVILPCELASSAAGAPKAVRLSSDAACRRADPLPRDMPSMATSARHTATWACAPDTLVGRTRAMGRHLRYRLP